MRHIVIWQGEDRDIRGFALGMSNNMKLEGARPEQVYLICASSLTAQAEGLPHFDIPAQLDNADEWRSVLTSIYAEIASHVQFGGERFSELVLDVIISATKAPTARPMLEAIHEATKNIPHISFHMHIMLQVDTISVHDQQQIGLLRSLIKDVTNKSLYDAEREQKKGIIDDEINAELNEAMKQAELSAVDANGNPCILTEDDRFNIHSQFAAKKVQRIAEVESELQKQYSTLNWNLLSLLGDADESGSREALITQTRADILASVVFGYNIDLEHRFICHAYGVQRSPYTLQDVQRLPNSLLYEKLCEAHESVEQAQERLCPARIRQNLSIQISQAITLRRAELMFALLADDNNYESRTSAELLGKFMEYNKRLLSQMIGIDKIANNWLLDGKKLLARWIDVDAPVQDYIMNTDAPSLESDIKSAISNEAKQTPKAFGTSNKRLRKMNAGDLLDQDLCSKLVTCCLERYLELLPQLRSFLQHMNQVNSQLFQGCSLELNKLLRDTVWMRKLLPDARQFTLRDLMVTEDVLTTEGSVYRDWLTTELKRLFPSFRHDSLDPSINAQNFITEAVQYAPQYPSFKMIDHSFYAAMVDGLAHQLRLGADCRIYRLTPYKVQLLNLGQGGTLDALFLHHPGTANTTSTAGAKQTGTAASQRRMVAFEPDKLNNMEVTLQLETGGFRLSWLKPTTDLQAEVKIVDESGITYYETIYNYEDSTHGSITKIPASAVPFGKKLTITITSYMYLISDEITLDPVEVALEMVENTGFLRNLLHGNSGSQMRVRIPQDKFKKAPRDQWAMVVKTHAGAFKYPVTHSNEWLLQAADGITPYSVSMVMKGAE